MATYFIKRQVDAGFDEKSFGTAKEVVEFLAPWLKAEKEQKIKEKKKKNVKSGKK